MSLYTYIYMPSTFSDIGAMDMFCVHTNKLIEILFVVQKDYFVECWGMSYGVGVLVLRKYISLSMWCILKSIIAGFMGLLEKVRTFTNISFVLLN